MRIDRAAANTEEMSEISAYWKITQHQLVPGPYQGRVRAIHTPNMQVGVATRTRSTQIDGTSPQGSVVFGFGLPSAGAIFFRDGRLESHETGVIRSGEEIAAKTVGRSRILTVALAQTRWDESAAALGHRSFDEFCPGDRMIFDTHGAAGNLGKELAALLDEQFAQPTALATPALENFERQVTTELFSRLEPPAAKRPAPERRRFARLAERYLRENAHHPLDLLAVCEAVATTPRTLELGFRETFNLSLKAYLQALRFNGARRELLAADPKQESVKAIALHWGFKHFGRFAVEYRRWFCESPSATLAR